LNDSDPSSFTSTSATSGVSVVSASKLAKPPSIEPTLVGFFAITARACSTVRAVSLLESWANAKRGRDAPMAMTARRIGRWNEMEFMAGSFISG
jgi:hypothetical protein